MDDNQLAAGIPDGKEEMDDYFGSTDAEDRYFSGEDSECDYEYAYDDHDIATLYTFREIIDTTSWSLRLRLYLIILRARWLLRRKCNALRVTLIIKLYHMVGRKHPLEDIPF